MAYRAEQALNRRGEARNTPAGQTEDRRPGGDASPVFEGSSREPRYPLPMRYILVPQTGQVPLVAGLPFFIVTALGFRISLWVRHFRQ